MARIPKRLPRDVNARAIAIARAAIGEDQENVDPRAIDAITAAREKAAKGGRARATTLPPAKRRQIARTAAATRWKNKK